MRKLLLFGLLLSVLLLTGCDTAFVATPITETTAVPRVETILPDLTDDGSLVLHDTATLFFRYLDEPYLAPETRIIRQLPSQSYEQALLTELIAGPGATSADLGGLFPQRVRVLSTSRQGRTMFVTLSAEIMDAYPDEPMDWQESDKWRREVPLRRLLCMQAIVATLTENCNADQVQILVQTGGVTSSLRLKQNYFMDASEDDVVVGPMRRRSELLLTADNTADVLLTCWQTQDWPRLYLYVAARDYETGADRPVYRDFVSRMEALPRLSGFTLDRVSTTQDGRVATVPMDASVLRSGAEVSYPDRILHLHRENGLWKISLAQLIGWLEDEV